MRIISGDFKGLKLHIPDSKNIRPLKDIAKEGIFNLLTHSNKIPLELKKSNVLDLYSGTGSFGLECLSRRAGNVYFVEKDKVAIEILNKNIEKLKIKKKIKIFNDDVFYFVEKKIFDFKFDLIFCDPPFKEERSSYLIELIFKKNFLKKNGIIVLHRKKDNKDLFFRQFNIFEERIYGISKIIFAKFSA